MTQDKTTPSTHNSTTSIDVGLPEFSSSIIVGTATGVASTLAMFETTVRPAMKKAREAVKKATSDATAMYEKAAASHQTMSAFEKEAWVDEQVLAAPAVMKARRISEAIPGATTIREAFTQMPTRGKVSIGVLAVGAGLAAGYLVHRWRSSVSHSDELLTPTSEQSAIFRQLRQELSPEHNARRIR